MKVNGVISKIYAFESQDYEKDFLIGIVNGMKFKQGFVKIRNHISPNISSNISFASVILSRVIKLFIIVKNLHQELLLSPIK